MKRRHFIAGASAAVAAAALGVPAVAAVVPEIAGEVLTVSPPCLGYSKPAAWVGRSVVLQVGDGLGNWQTISNLKTMVVETKEFA